MSKKLAPVITLLLASVLPVFPQTSVQGSAQNQNAGLQDPVIRASPHKGDLDEMDQRRVVRALVTFNRASFFFDNGRPRGMTYDALVDFEKFLAQAEVRWVQIRRESKETIRKLSPCLDGKSRSSTQTNSCDNAQQQTHH